MSSPACRCRVCLVDNVKMFYIQNDRFLDVYQKLTNTMLNIADRPQGVCSICFVLLRRCCRFSEMARRSEQILTDLLNHEMEIANKCIASLDLSTKHNIINLSISPTEYWGTDLISINECSFKTVKYEAKIKFENTSSEDEHSPENTIIEDVETSKHQRSHKTRINIKTEQTTTRLNSMKKTYTCNICHKEYHQKNRLLIHIRTHTGEKPYTCAQCYRKFYRHCTLVKHIEQTHTGKKSATCEQCGKSFYDKDNLNKHMRTHTGEKPYTCKQCHRGFSHSNNLVKHMRTHTGEKPYACKLCNKRFTQNGSLQSHLRTHSGEKPYTCERCGKSFPANRNLIAHIRLHTGERPFSCQQCDKTYCKKNDLVTHMRTHTGEKPYLCKGCDKSFSRKSHLMKHAQTHGQKPCIKL